MGNLASSTAPLPAPRIVYSPKTRDYISAPPSSPVSVTEKKEEKKEEKKDRGRKDVIRDVFIVTKKLAELNDELNSHKTRSQKLGFFPIQNIEAYRRAKILESSFWIAQEIGFERDIPDFVSLPMEEQNLLLRTFGFFAVGDGSVLRALVFRLIALAENEEQLFYIKQIDNETVHAETYGLMIEHLVGDKKKAEEVRNYADSISSIKKMTDFLESIVDKSMDEKTAFVSLAIAEYLFFSPLFAIIFWFRAFRKGKMLRTIFSNEQIAKDEGLHCLNGCAMYKKLDDRFTDTEINSLMNENIKLMDDFILETLTDCPVPHFKIDDFKQYVRYIADDLLHELGHPPCFNVENPFVWMSFIHFRNKTNFYESEVGEYQRGNVKRALQDAIHISEGTLRSKEKHNLFTGEIGF